MAQKLHPDAIMERCVSGVMAGASAKGHITYAPPPVQRNPVPNPRPYRAPRKDDADGVMPFYDEALSSKP